MLYVIFPSEHIATLLIRFALNHKGVLPYGWAPRILVQCGVPFLAIWDVLHEMYESQVCDSDTCFCSIVYYPYAIIDPTIQRSGKCPIHFF